MDEILLKIKKQKIQLNELQEAIDSEALAIKEVQGEITDIKNRMKAGYEGPGFIITSFYVIIILLAILWIGLISLGANSNIYNGSSPNTGSETILFMSPAIIAILIVIWFWRSFNDSKNNDKAALIIYENKKNKLSKSQNLPNNKREIFDSLNGEIKSLEKKYFDKLVTHFTNIYDSNQNGELDIIENSDDYIKILQTNQDKILEISEKMGVEYIDPLIKIDEKLNLKRESLNLTLKKILEPAANYDDELNIEILEQYLKKEIQTYNAILTNSLFMVSSLIANDRITFRKIYEKFDRLNMFNSNYENQTIELLSNVNKNLVQLLSDIDDLNQSISQSIANLAYVTEENSNKLSSQLEKVNSSIDVNTLVTGIAAYQAYKINKNTKSLRE